MLKCKHNSEKQINLVLKYLRSCVIQKIKGVVIMHFSMPYFQKFSAGDIGFTFSSKTKVINLDVNFNLLQSRLKNQLALYKSTSG